ncbi:MAG: hypothetical protein Q8P82_00145, partial [bacterium]|nr:hypothetical protein [bacterium]
MPREEAPSEEIPQVEKRKGPPPIPESERRESVLRQALLDAISGPDIEPPVALEIVASYDEKNVDDDSIADIRMRAEQFGLPWDAMDQKDQQQLLVLSMSVAQTGKQEMRQQLSEILERTMREKLVEKALSRIDQLQAEILEADSIEQVKERLRTVLESIHTLAKQVPPEQAENTAAWQ